MNPSVRKITYVSGTRADFGLMQSTLQAINTDPQLAINLVVTGMHLSPYFGNTVDEIVSSGLHIGARIPVNVEESTGAAMAHNLGLIISGCVDAFERLQPDIVLILGDRAEMLAGALAAIHLNIPVAHIHGGERSGTVDEPIRHSISKLSHFHFVSSEDARERLVKMGEDPKNIFVTGAPGLDGLLELAVYRRDELCAGINFNPLARVGLLLYHPVLQQAAESEDQFRTIVEVCLSQEIQLITVMPNSDAGSSGIRRVLEGYVRNPKVYISSHLPRKEFISWMATCDIMIGNSSSGIIEAASFGTPVVNVGIRQNLRQRNLNIVEAAACRDSIAAAVSNALAHGRYSPTNIYGDGQAGRRIIDRLLTVNLANDVLLKVNTY